MKAVEVEKQTKKPSAKGANGAVVLELPRLEVREMLVRCTGLTELVISSMMNKSGRSDPKAGGTPSEEAQFNRARYIVDGVDCFKAMTLKKAIAGAWQFCGTGGNKMKGLIYKTLRVHGDIIDPMGVPFITIDGKPQVFTAEIRNDKGQSMLTTRPRYWPWAFSVRLTYNPEFIRDQVVLQLLANAGTYCGIGENRPSKTGGDWRRFQIDASSKIVCRTVLE